MAETTPTTKTTIVEKVARAICYWADPAKNGSCHDNFCVGACSAVQPEQQHYDQARAAIAALEASTQLLQTMAGALERIERCTEYEYGSTGPRSTIARTALAQFRAQEQRS